MPIIKTITGNLLNADEKFIAHQCNCVTAKSHGLSQSIAAKFPWADVYKTRVNPRQPLRNFALIPSIPGTIEIMTDSTGITDLSVICLFAQWCPGKCDGKYNKYYPTTYVDNPENRHTWFQNCLDAIDNEERIDGNIAMPYFIGCGLAGGDWEIYKGIINNMTKNVVLYKL